jgi:tRNA-binding protein
MNRASYESQKVAPIKPTIAFDVLEKIDIRVGTIEVVENIHGADKLVRLTVDFGDHKRKIIVGIKKERGNPQEIEGKQALFVVNLAPKKMMGEISEGMLFDIGYADNITPVLAISQKPVRNGSRAG